MCQRYHYWVDPTTSHFCRYVLWTCLLVPPRGRFEINVSVWPGPNRTSGVKRLRTRSCVVSQYGPEAVLLSGNSSFLQDLGPKMNGHKYSRVFREVNSFSFRRSVIVRRIKRTPCDIRGRYPWGELPCKDPFVLYKVSGSLSSYRRCRRYLVLVTFCFVLSFLSCRVNTTPV